MVTWMRLTLLRPRRFHNAPCGSHSQASSYLLSCCQSILLFQSVPRKSSKRPYLAMVSIVNGAILIIMLLGPHNDIDVFHQTHLMYSITHLI